MTSLLVALVAVGFMVGIVLVAIAISSAIADLARLLQLLNG